MGDYVIKEGRAIKHTVDDDGRQRWAIPDVPIRLIDHHREVDIPLFRARLLAARQNNEVLVINGQGYVLSVSACWWPRCQHLQDVEFDGLNGKVQRLRCTHKKSAGLMMTASKWRCGGRFHSEWRQPKGLTAYNLLQLP